MKFVIFLLAAVVLAVTVQESQAIKCRTGYMTVDCNTCTCDKETGQLGACTLIGCYHEKAIQCADGEEKQSGEGNMCECLNNTWYCDKPLNSD